MPIHPTNSSDHIRIEYKTGEYIVFDRMLGTDTWRGSSSYGKSTFTTAEILAEVAKALYA